MKTCLGLTMLEETHFAGAPPDTGLVYELRRLASTGASLEELLDMTVEGGYRGGFAFAVYFVLSFGVPIPLMKECGSHVSEDTSNAQLAGLEIAERVSRAIKSSRRIWENRLEP